MSKIEKLEELNVLKEKVQKCQESLSANEKIIKELLKSQEVKDYKSLSDENAESYKFINNSLGKIARLEMELCSDDLWCFISKDECINEAIYWKCMCLECYKEEERRPHDFNNVIFPPKDIDVIEFIIIVRNEYQRLKQIEFLTHQEIIKFMLARYSQKNQLSELIKQNNVEVTLEQKRFILNRRVLQLR